MLGSSFVDALAALLFVGLIIVGLYILIVIDDKRDNKRKQAYKPYKKQDKEYPFTIEEEID